jgi:DNA-binding NtrC family response regulator
VRELRNLLQRAMVRCQDGIIRAEDLNLEIPPAPSAARKAPPTALPGSSLSDLEKDYIRDLLDKHGGHRRTVADLLGITERTLYRKLKQHGLK